MRYVSPTYFSPESCIGGGERYAEELARAMAAYADVRLISFGRRARRERRSATLEHVILASWTRDKMTPFSPHLFAELRDADVVHCYQYFVLPTFLSALYAHLRGRRVFVSDLGGGGWTPAYHIDQSRWLTAHLPISEYAARGLRGCNRVARVILGGVDTERFAMRTALEHDRSVIYLGRILPHKGIHDLVEALPPAVSLDVIGTEQDAAYRARLERLAAGKRVRFLCGLPDADVIARLRSAMALVHFTPINVDGTAGANELFGLALAEAMSCGCPVIATATASLPEVVGADLAELLVPPGDGAVIRQRIQRLADDQPTWARLAVLSRRRVESALTWHHVAARCLAAYDSCGYS